jgi:DNA ligase (NAD+)
MDVTKQTKVDKSLSIVDRIAFLRHCAKLYETNGTSPITDAEYDVEYYELEALIPNDPFFDEVGGLAVDAIQGQSVPHKVIMGSLSKSLDIPSTLAWLKSQYPLITPQTSFILQHKIDGLSLGLIYQNGKLVQALTRGDGVTGIDVTEKAKTVKGVRHTIPCKDDVEVRGECFKNRQDFYKKWHTSVGGVYKNPRNFTAGAMNEKDPEETKKKELEFIAYEVVRKDFDTEVEKNAWLSQQGFDTLNPSTKRTKEGVSVDRVAKAVEVYMAAIDRANLPYDIDGVVLKLNDIKMAKKMGATSGGRKPKANRAIKFPPSKKETILKDVIPQIGRTGVVKPVGILEGVELDGAMIKRVSLHNYGSLVGKDAIKLGSTVVVAKKGDIIPQIVEVKKMGHKDIPLPTTCPECSEKLEWDDNQVELVCNNSNCVAQLNKRIEYWFKTIGVKGFGKGTIKVLTDQDELEWDGKPIVSSLVEMYYMLDNDRKTEHPFRKYAYLKANMGEKTYDNLLASIKSVTEVSLPTFIEALGIENIGSSSKDIADVAPTIDDVDKLTADDLGKLDGFGIAKINSFLTSWKARRDEIRRLLKYITIKQVAQASDKLKGKKFCFTGSFANPTRGEMEKMVGENGGKLASVSSELTALVFDGETMKGKYEKAQKLNVPIITQDDFMAMLK